MRSPRAVGVWSGEATLAGGVLVAAATDIGFYMPLDAVAIEPGRGIVLVVDGETGTPGDAAEIAIDAVMASDGLVDGLAAADREMARRRAATPAACAIAARFDGGELTIAHVGDCRGYLFRHGQIHPITRDHDLVRAFAESTTCTETERAGARAQFGNVLTRVLGFGGAADEIQLTLQPNDRVVLCTDGLHRALNDAALLALITAAAPPVSLIAAARDAGSRDKVTLAIATVPSDR